ncbi:hypothetical protein ABLO27_09925 [Roseibium sp. SCPC15]|uniref:hypothetical protein n=1 Tax=Roseibium sp. SCP15 TaxID=3141376 RepID=UPI0033373D49
MAAFAMALMPDYSAFSVMFSCIAFYSGWAVRCQLKKLAGGPAAWIIPNSVSFLIFPAIQRRPMLIFDVWTVGLAGLTGVMFLAPVLN